MKVSIRPLQVEDAYTSVKWRNDAEVFRYTRNTYDHVITIDSELEWIKRVIANKDEYRCAIIAEDKYVGNIYLTKINEESAVYQIFIGDKGFWGKGVAREASIQILNYAKNVLGLDNVRLTVREDNIKARQLYKSLGFKEINVKDNWITMRVSLNYKPLVVIRTPIYNHEPYLRDYFEGIVSQQTNFPFVAIVHDDCSKDGSAAIIREYAEKYPDIIKPIFETENQYSKHDGSLRRIMNDAVKATGAKYVAICEGDDYWTDPLKLKKQVDILESDETLMACCTNCSVVDNHSQMIHSVRPEPVVKDNIEGRYTLRDFFQDNHQYPTLSVVYRNAHVDEVRAKHAHTENAFLGDWTLWICLLIYGDMYFLNEVTCAYRINPTSVTHTVNRVARAKASIDICNKVADILPDEYADIATDLRDTRWVWISLIFAYKAERRYLGMVGSMIMACFACPGTLWRTIRKRKG